MTTFAVTNEEDILPALNYVLSNLDLNGSGGNANIPSNVLVANTTSGEITTYGGDKYGFFYQYINLRYGNSATGTGFTTVPANTTYFGTYNSSTQTPSANPTDYTWTEVSGGFGTTKTIYYSAIGGRQVVWVAANSAPSSSFVVSVANVAIDLDVVTTAAGLPGERGPVSMAYIVTTSDPNLAISATLTTWFSASPAGPTAPIGTGLNPPVLGDIATFTWAAGSGTPTATNTFNGSIWVPAYAQRISGNVVIAGTLAANALVANSITATQIATGSLTTDLFTANTISGNIITVATLNGNAITANTINGNTIIANSFLANTINGSSLIIGTVSNTQIANGTITTNQVAANTITATNIAVGANITGSQIAANTITAQNLVANTLTANTVVSTGATLGSYISQGFWLDGPTGTARFGNTLSIGNNLTVGNGASIGGNLTVGGLISSGNLIANTVTTTTVVPGSLSDSISFSVGANTLVANATAGVVYKLAGPSITTTQFNQQISINAVGTWLLQLQPVAPLPVTAYGQINGLIVRWLTSNPASVLVIFTVSKSFTQAMPSLGAVYPINLNDALVPPLLDTIASPGNYTYGFASSVQYTFTLGNFIDTLALATTRSSGQIVSNTLTIQTLKR